MTGPSASSENADPLAVLNNLFLLLMLAIIAGVLTTAMTMQYVYGELPCPLCLLERVALFGVAFGIGMNFRHGFSYRNTGISLLFAIFSARCFGAPDAARYLSAARA